VPKKRRDTLIQYYNQTQGALDKSLYYLGEMKSMYGDEAPFHGSAVAAVAMMIVTTKDYLRQFRIEHM